MRVTESTWSVSIPDHIAHQVVLPEGHREHGPLFAAYQWLRENAPLAKVHVEGYDPLWLVAKHADIFAKINDAVAVQAEARPSNSSRSTADPGPPAKERT